MSNDKSAPPQRPGANGSKGNAHGGPVNGRARDGANGANGVAMDNVRTLPVAKVAGGRIPAPRTRRTQVDAHLKRFAQLAALGLTEEEILYRCDISDDQLPCTWDQFDEALYKGRALGRALLKETLMETALGGGITAMRLALTLLEGEGAETDDSEEEIEVFRKIIGEKTGEEAPGD